MPKKSLREHLEENFDESQRKTIYFIHDGMFNPLNRSMQVEFIKINARLDAIDTRFPSAIQKIDSVEEFVNGNKFAILDFFSEFCIPCFEMEPSLEKIARDNGVAVGKIDVDEHKNVVNKYDVSALPLFISFRDGDVVQRLTGAPRTEERRLQRIRLMSQRLLVPDDEYEKIYARVKKIADAKGWELNPERSTVDGLVAGMAYNEMTYGRAYCVCRAEREPSTVCPCRWSSEEVARDGHCLCDLFFSKELARKYRRLGKEEKIMTIKGGK